MAGRNTDDVGPMTNATPRRSRRLAAGGMALAFSLWCIPVWADVAPEPGLPDSPQEDDSLCAYGQKPGDDCTTEDGEDGTCSDETEICYSIPTAEPQECYVCDENCSVASCTKHSPSGAAVLLAVLGLFGLVRRRSA